MSKFSTLLTATLLSFSDCALAEGNCPPGYYPIGSPTTPGCAPIPTQQGAAEGAGHWSSRYGAIASDSSNLLMPGVSKNERSFAAADSAAIKDCKRKGGGSGCRVQASFGNGCAAYAVGEGITVAQVGDSEESAIQNTKEECENKSPGASCRVSFAVCSEPKIV